MLFVTQRYHGEGCFFKQKKKLWNSQTRDVISAKRNMGPRVGLRQKWIHREGKQWKEKWKKMKKKKKQEKNKNSIFTESGRARNVRTSDIALLLSITSFTSNFQKRACGGENARTLSCPSFKHFVHSNVCFSEVNLPRWAAWISLNSAPSSTDKGPRLPALPCFVCVLSVFFSRASKNAPVEKYKIKKQPLKSLTLYPFSCPCF